MDNGLAEALVCNKLLKPNSEVEAIHYSKGLGPTTVRVTGQFVVRAVKKTASGSILFDLQDPYNNTVKATAYAADIIRIGGMDPVTYARAFKLDASGQPLNLGAKRGRKSKPDLIALMIEQFMDLGLIDDQCWCDAYLDDTNADDEDDAVEPIRDVVVIRGVEYEDDEDPLIIVETVATGERHWINPTRILDIDCIPLSEWIDDFKTDRRVELMKKKEKRNNGRHHQLRGEPAGETATGTQG